MMPWPQKGLLETKKTNRSLLLVPIGSSVENLYLRAWWGRCPDFCIHLQQSFSGGRKRSDGKAHPTGQL